MARYPRTIGGSGLCITAFGGVAAAGWAADGPTDMHHSRLFGRVADNRSQWRNADVNPMLAKAARGCKTAFVDAHMGIDFFMALVVGNFGIRADDLDDNNVTQTNDGFSIVVAGHMDSHLNLALRTSSRIVVHVGDDWLGRLEVEDQPSTLKPGDVASAFA